MTDLGFIHRYEPASVAHAPPVLLLHGTGGDENDLIELGHVVAPGSALLSPRGNVLERGMPRFFRRLAEGVFDEADIRLRAGQLAGFVAAARKQYGLAAPIALGFSNGANIAAALLLEHPDVLAGAVLFRAMTPLVVPADRPIDGIPVLIVSGAQDPLAPVANPARLTAQLRERGAIVDHRIVPAGHGLIQADVDIASAWLDVNARTAAHRAMA
ncbi:MAG: alpha/beta hydrolase [Rhodopseudomonas sp.]|nr:alpha/beta hydrolase [Rhodopseudomonas sp.]